MFRTVLRILGVTTFWPPGSGSVKICRSTNPDPSAKCQPKTAYKEIFYSQYSNI